MKNRFLFRVPVAAALTLVLPLFSCGRHPQADTLVMIIESTPTNLDPRVGTDAQSERIYKLIFDALLTRDEHFNVRPGLAERWEIRDPLTYVFHLRRGVRFHDGRPLTARDVKWTLDSTRDGSLITPKASTYRQIGSVEAADDYTVIVRLKEPYGPLLWNLADGAFGVVPYGSGTSFNRLPMGSGPFRFVRLEQDKEVVLERNDAYWGERPRLARVRFAIVPDTTTRALELRKGSADLAINALTADMVKAMEGETNLVIERAPGTIYGYLAFNLRDPVLREARVRQALAHAINRQTLIHYLWRDTARVADNILPPEHWAYNADVPHYAHDPERARRLLDEAGFPAKQGVRFHLAMKTSTEESSRLLAVVLQQQLREVGIALDIRSFEFATFYSDVVKGAFQVYSLRWIGGNEDPDIFEHVFHSASVPPRRANRSYYANAKVDGLIEEARRTVDQQRRKQLYGEVQHIVAEELPYIHLWYFDNVVVHSRRVSNVHLSHSGNYDFLKTAELAR